MLVFVTTCEKLANFRPLSVQMLYQRFAVVAVGGKTEFQHTAEYRSTKAYRFRVTEMDQNFSPVIGQWSDNGAQLSLTSQ